MEIRAEVLSKILLIQNMLDRLPDEESMFSFVCRGLEDFPGVKSVIHVKEDEEKTLQKNVLNTQHYPLHINNNHYGEIIIELSNTDAIKPYSGYIHNICFMIAVILEERRQRSIIINHSKILEQEVEERTKQLSKEIKERKEAQNKALKEKERAEQYLEIAEAIIVELDEFGNIIVINKRGCKLLGYTPQEMVGKNWFDLVISADQRNIVLDTFKKLMSGELEPVEYFENDVITRSHEKRFISWHNSFKYDESGKIIGTISSGQDITDRKKAEEIIRQGLEEKDTLLKELYHRTRNIMMVISGLLILQAASTDNKKVIEILYETDRRIQSMALIHKKLYQSKSLSMIDLKEYLVDFVSLLVSSYQISDDKIQLDLDIQSIQVNVETGVPCGLLVNELISNAIKYAFPDNSYGTISVSLKMGDDGYIELMVSDNGVGLDQSFDIKSLQSLGMQIIYNITEKQLEGNVRFENNNGLSWFLRFPMKQDGSIVKGLDVVNNS